MLTTSHATPIIISMNTNETIVIDTSEGISFYRLAALKSALSIEVKTNGALKMSRGVSPYAILKREYGYKGNKAAVLAAVSAEVERQIAAKQAKQSS